MHRLVGWAKALAGPCFTMETLVRRAHAVIIRNCARPRGHGARGTSRCGTAVPTPLPTLRFPVERQAHTLCRRTGPRIGRDRDARAGGIDPTDADPFRG